MTLERLVAWAASPRGPADWDLAAERLAELEQIGADQLLIEHQDAWEERWADAEVIIEGAPDDELAARFATFHLLASVPEAGEAAVGARGLSGPAYGGHVFWDADVFVLPALAAIRPAAARAMLEYRLARLSAAHTRALETGATGARFPWESAGDGTEVTPREARHPNGDVVPILTGDQEEHIVADIAWAARHYASWTGDIGFVHAAGRPLIVDTARYWAGRIRIDRDGHGHLDTVIGPDEYHEAVDDNAFTNVMARWNLRRGAELLVDDPCEPGDDELARHWHELAEGLVDGWDPDRGLYEQFSGYFELEPLLAADVAPPPFAADLMLGRERVTTSQLIKQADVIMLHHLVPDELVDDSLPADLAFYEPRTAHGSSLSPAVHAAAFARAGQPDRALQLFRMASRLDLDDLTGTTTGGLHLAAMGGVWQALAYGFLGLRAEGDVLRIDPHLPGAWDALSMRVRFRGRPITIRADHISITVTSETPIAVRIGSDSVEQLCAASTRHLLPERASEEASAGNIR